MGGREAISFPFGDVLTNGPKWPDKEAGRPIKMAAQKSIEADKKEMHTQYLYKT